MDQERIMFRNKLADHLGSMETANKVMEMFPTVRYYDWCESPKCGLVPDCPPTHQQFILKTQVEELLHADG